MLALESCINAALKQDPIHQTAAAGRRLVRHFKQSAKATAALTKRKREIEREKVDKMELFVPGAEQRRPATDLDL